MIFLKQTFLPAVRQGETGARQHHRKRSPELRIKSLRLGYIGYGRQDRILDDRPQQGAGSKVQWSVSNPSLKVFECNHILTFQIKLFSSLSDQLTISPPGSKEKRRVLGHMNLRVIA